MKTLHSLLAIALLLSTGNLLADSHEEAGQANAGVLVGHAQSAVGQVVPAAQADPSLTLSGVTFIR